MASKNKLTVSQIAKRAGITARELRDVVTAVSTAADLRGSTPISKNLARKNVGKQITETVKAATTGKSGTRSGQTLKRGDVKVVKLYGTPTDVRLYGTGKEGKKRK